MDGCYFSVPDLVIETCKGLYNEELREYYQNMFRSIADTLAGLNFTYDQLWHAINHICQSYGLADPNQINQLTNALAEHGNAMYRELTQS